MDRPSNSPQLEALRTLSSGLEVTCEEVIDKGDEVSFVFEFGNVADFEGEFPNPIVISDKTVDLYHPESTNHPIVDGLVKKGWITEDGTIVVPYQFGITRDTHKRLITYTFRRSKGPRYDGLVQEN